jgi:CRP-like cAMP-binding protein
VTSVEVIRSVPLFQGMTDRSVETIAELAAPVAFGQGDALVREGEAGETFIVLTSGAADVTKAGAVLRRLGPGDYLGEISLIDGGARTATVIATAPIEALIIDRAGFGRLMAEFTVVRFDLVSALTRRLRERSSDVTD